MGWLQVRVAVAGSDADAVAELLQAQGAMAVTVSGGAGDDAVEELVLEPMPGQQPLWRRVELSALFDTGTDLRALRETLTAASVPVVAVDFIDEDDWQERWRAHAVRHCFGDRLWLVPRDEAPPDVRPGQAVLRLDPGLAFGSGSHPTTRLCLEWLSTADLHGARVLDFGCGSGVLAVAACLLGASEVVGIDHDPQALVATRDNADHNRIAPQHLRVGLPAQLAELQGGRPFDVVVANILANPLVELAPRLLACLAPAGWLVLSGLLHDQAADVRAAYPQLRFAAAAREAEWIRLDGRRPGGGS